MAIGDLESALPKKLTHKLAAYSSSWWDMRHAVQILHSRSLLGEEAQHYFARRGLLDGAVITYARCFADGKRTPQADIRSLLTGLTPALASTHETVLWWRNKHVGHRVDQDLERVDALALWGNFGAAEPTVRMRIRTRVRPDTVGFEDDFAELAATLATQIWDVFLLPLQHELFDELGAEGLDKLKAAAKPYIDPKTAVGEIIVAMSLGSRS